MRIISGIKMAASFGLLLSFSICLVSKAGSGSERETSVSIPYLNIREADQEGLFLLVFDVSGSMWSDEKDQLAEDFKNIYLYLSEQPWAVEHDVILFDEKDRLRSEIIKDKGVYTWIKSYKKEEEVWAQNKNTDLKNAFKRLDNYLSGTSDKRWVDFVMVSDFYDSFKGKAFESRKEEMDEITVSFDKERSDKNYRCQTYFIFDSPEEAKSGYEQYIPPVNKESNIKIEEISEKSGEDCHAEAKRRFTEKVLQGLTGDQNLKWIHRKELESNNFIEWKDYFVYSDRKINVSGDYSASIVWSCALKSGGYLYHVNGATMEELKLNRGTNECYVLAMPHVKAMMYYTMADDASCFQEGKVEVILELKDSGWDQIRADNFDVVFFTLSGAKKQQGVSEYCQLEKKQTNYRGEVELKPGNYNVRLRRRDGDIFLDQIIEKDFIVPAKKEK
ncbi:MAG: hypothetical protein HFG70_00790 [Hungatella sp.]|nr:hypothetical protein [Hungatella sp.]